MNHDVLITLLIIIVSAIVGGIIMFGSVFIITQKIDISLDVGCLGITLGAFAGYWLVQLIVVGPILVNDSVSSSTDVHVEQTVSQNSISVDELRGMTVEEIQDLIKE